MLSGHQWVRSAPPKSATKLRAELEDLRHRAGRPSLRAIGRQAGCSHTTVSKIFADPTSSTWKAIGYVISALDGDTDYFRELWYQATGGTRGQAGGYPMSFTGLHDDDMTADCPRTEDRLLAELDTTIDLSAGPQAMARLHLVDYITLRACKIHLQQDLYRYYDMPAAPPGCRHLRVGHRILRCGVEPDPLSERTMRVTIQDHRTPAAQHRSQELSVGPQMGRFNRLLVTAPGSLIGWLVETCENRLAALITSAYRWLGRLITQYVTLVSSPFEEESLQLLRKLLPSELLAAPVARSVLLVLVSQGRASYAIDEPVVRGAMAVAQSNVRDVYVPAVAISDMFFNSISFSHSFSRRAIHCDRPVSVDLSRAPYQRIAQDILLAETAILHRASLLAPVVSTPEVAVLASYPAGISSSLAAVMPRLRAELTPRAARLGQGLRAPITRDANQALPHCPNTELDFWSFDQLPVRLLRDGIHEDGSRSYYRRQGQARRRPVQRLELRFLVHA